MKKIKLIGIALLASTFGLTSCELPEFAQKLIPGTTQKEEKEEIKGEVVSVKVSGVPTSVITDESEAFQLTATVEAKNGASEEVTWKSSDTSIATVDSTGLVTPVYGGSGRVTITATAKDDATKSHSVSFYVSIVPAVTSISVTVPSSAYKGTTVQAVAEVSKKGEPDTSVTWSTSDPSIATVDANGVVSCLAEGTVSIIATSKSNSDKSGSATLLVGDGGLHPELIVDEGLSYSKSWPGSALHDYLGEDPFELHEENGFYYVYSPATEETEDEDAQASYFMVLAEMNNDLVAEFAGAVQSYGNFDYDEVYCFINPGQTFEVDFDTISLSEETSLFAFVFYHVDEIWKSSTDTTDVEWDYSTSSDIKDNGVEIPFVTLGEYYDSYVYSDGTVEISDYCADFNKLNNYDKVLEAAGFEKTSSNGYEIYVKDYGYKTCYIYYEFGYYGNTIDAWVEMTEFDHFPSEYLDPFTESIPSKYTVPAYDQTEGASYYYNEGEIELDEEGEITAPSASISIYTPTQAECEAYIGELIADGYEVVESYSEYFGTSGIALTKGKIVVQAVIEYESREANDEEIAALLAITEEEVAAMTDEEYDVYYMNMLYYYFTGSFPVYEYDTVYAAHVTVYGDSEGMEDPGLYIYGATATITDEETYQINPIFFEIDEQDVVYSSSDETIATVSESGLVTPVSVGEVEITVSIPESEYSDSIIITVKEAAHITEALEDLNAWIESCGSSQVLNLPDVDGAEGYEGGYDEDYDCYSIYVDIYEGEEAYAAKLAELGFDVSYDEDYGYFFIQEDVLVSFYDSFFGGMYIDVYVAGPELSGEVVVDFTAMGYENAESIVDLEYEGLLIDFDKGTNNNPPKYYESGDAVRFYGANTITITATEGGVINEVVFDMTGSNGVTADSGEFDEDTWTWTAPEGGVESVTFTIGGTSGHMKIKSISVYGEGFGDGEGGGGGQSGDVTVAKACTDICYNLYGEETNNFELYDGDYYLDLEWGSTDKYTLESAVLEAVNYLPEYFLELQAPEAFTWEEDGSDGFGGTYGTEDYSIFCEVASYVEDGSVIVQFCVYTY